MITAYMLCWLPVLWRHIPTCCEYAWLAVREGTVLYTFQLKTTQLILIREIITVYWEKLVEYISCVEEKRGVLIVNMVVIPAPKLPS